MRFVGDVLFQEDPPSVYLVLHTYHPSLVQLLIDNDITILLRKPRISPDPAPPSLPAKLILHTFDPDT